MIQLHCKTRTAYLRVEKAVIRQRILIFTHKTGDSWVVQTSKIPRLRKWEEVEAYRLKAILKPNLDKWIKGGEDELRQGNKRD